MVFYYVDAGQALAARERMSVNRCDGIGGATISDGYRDDYGIRILIVLRRRCSLKGDGGFAAVDVEVDTIHLEVVGHGECWQQEGQQHQ